MNDIELVSAITWHLECMVLAATEIDNFRPPTDSFQKRMHYSLYLANLMSAIDMVSEKCGRSFETALKDNLKTSNLSGAEVLGYIRELRNGIVHRGIDPTSSATVVDGLICAVSPLTVQTRGGDRSFPAPAPLLRDVFIHCEVRTKPIIERFLEPTFKKLASPNPEALLSDALRLVDAAPHMPDWAKEMAHKALKPEDLVRAQAHEIEKLRGLLKPWTTS